MRQIFTVLIVAGLFATAGCASTEGATAGENSADSGAEVKAAGETQAPESATAGENSADSGAEVKAAGETQATGRRCCNYTPTGSHRSVRSCSGARGGDSRVQISGKEELEQQLMRGQINTSPTN